VKKRLLALLLAALLLVSFGVGAAAAKAAIILKNDRFYCEIPQNYLFAGGGHFCFVSGDDRATRSIDIYTEPNRGGLSISSASEKALKMAFEAAYGAHSEQMISDPVYKTGTVNGCYAFGVHFTESFGSTRTPAEAYLLATEEWQYLLVFRCFSFDFVMADDVQTLLDSFVMNGTLNPGDAPEYTVDFSGAIPYEEELDAFDRGEGAGERGERQAEDELPDNVPDELILHFGKVFVGFFVALGAAFDVFALIMLVYFIRKYRLTKQANERYLRRYGFPAPDMKGRPAPPYPPQGYAPYPQYPPASPYPAYPAYPPYPPPTAPTAPTAPAGEPSETDKPTEPTEKEEEIV